MTPTKVDNGIVRIYCAGASPAQMAKMQEFCQGEGFQCQAIRGLGRKRGEYPILFVLDAIRRGCSIWATAKIYGLSPGTVKRIKDGDIS